MSSEFTKDATYQGEQNPYNKQESRDGLKQPKSLQIIRAHPPPSRTISYITAHRYHRLTPSAPTQRIAPSSRSTTLIPLYQPISSLLSGNHDLLLAIIAARHGKSHPVFGWLFCYLIFLSPEQPLAATRERYRCEGLWRGNGWPRNRNLYSAPRPA